MKQKVPEEAIGETTSISNRVIIQIKEVDTKIVGGLDLKVITTT